MYWLKTQRHASAGVDAHETPWHGRIKGATKAKSEGVRLPLTVMRTHKRSPSLNLTDISNLIDHYNLPFLSFKHIFF